MFGTLGSMGGMGANSFTGQNDIADALMSANNTIGGIGGENPADAYKTMEQDEIQAGGGGMEAMQKMMGAMAGGGGSELGGANGKGVIGDAMSLFTMFSDRRLKRNIRSIGQLRGVNIYSYNYIWDDVERYGVMADEVPHAAVEHSSGYMMVDYSKVL